MQRVDEMDYRLRERWREVVSESRRALDQLESRLGLSNVRLKLAGRRRRLDACENALIQSMERQISRARQSLGPAEAHLRQLSPLKILERGYAIVERDGKILKSPADAPADSEIRVRLAGGDLQAKVLPR